jgi:hypothetical protein
MKKYLFKRHQNYDERKQFLESFCDQVCGKISTSDGVEFYTINELADDRTVRLLIKRGDICYKFINTKSRKVGFYDDWGKLISSRKITFSERQMTIFQIAREELGIRL